MTCGTQPDELRTLSPITAVAELTEQLDTAEACAHDDPALAARIAEACASPHVREGHPRIAARAIYLLARLAADRADTAKALSLIESSRQLFEDAGCHLEALRTGLGRMAILDEIGRHRESIAVGSELMNRLDQFDLVAEHREPARLIRAMTANNLGVAYGEVGDHETALRNYTAASNIYRSLGEDIKYSHAAANRGIEMLASGSAHEALQVLRDAAASFAAAGDRLWAAKCGLYTARAQTALGDLAGALRTLEASREELRRLDAPAERARLQLAAAGVYLAAGLWREAHGEAVAAAERLAALSYTHDAAHARFTASCASLGAGDSTAAAAELADAALGYRMAGDTPHLLHATLVQAEIRQQQGYRAEARMLAEHAVTGLRTTGSQVPLIFGLLQLSGLVDDDRKAGELLQEAGRLVSQAGIAQLFSLHDLHTSRWHLRGGRPAQAEAKLRSACAGLEDGAHQLPGPLLRMAYRAHNVTAQDELIDVLVDRGTPESVREAWQRAHRIKTETMRELAIRMVGPEASGEVPAVDHHHRLSAVYRELAAARGQALRKRLTMRAAAIERRVVTAMVRRSAHTYVAPHSGPAPHRSSLPQSGLVLEYHVTGRDVLAFVLSAHGVQVRRLPNARQAIGAQLRRLRGEWSRFALGRQFTETHAEALLASTEDIMRRLHDLLIAPIQPLLDDEGSSELVIIPHRELYSVPFDALSDGTGTLAQRYSITYSADAATPARNQTPATLLVLAADDPDAPSMREEATAIATVLPAADVVIGPDATVERLARSLPGPDVVHLACHATFRADNPMFSSLHLAERSLTTADVLGLELDGALVVLSACESGRAATTIEPTGLTWAFLAAGASGVITSRWVADDQITAELMQQLYQEIATGCGPAVALQRAQATIAKSHPHPYYWAAFGYVAGAVGHKGAAS
ncbi:MAG TPA: CHAT domain-containing protein [Jatrophihabitantaceae bacterium]|nr:CHAT domain-containing protein [Jatrophihabitantaceae bacterium]